MKTVNNFFYSGYVEASMRTCLFLRDYEDIIDPCDIYSLLGMAYTHVHVKYQYPRLFC